ncbi:MAG: HEAT repeat domain-containing protein, partial [Planctomycetota bacterium]
MRNSAALLLVLLVAAGAAWAGEDPRVLVLRLGSADPAERRAAREALREAGADGSAALRDGLLSSEVPVAVACADLVREAGILEARAELLKVLGSGDAPKLLRHACCLALGRVGDYRDVELLGAQLPAVPAAALALAEIADPDGLGPLRQAFTADGPPEIAYALASLGDEAGISALIRALDGERGLAAGHYLRRLTGKDPGADRSAWELWWRRRKLALALGDPDWDRSEAALARVLERADGEGGAPEELVGDLLEIARDREAARDARTKSILALGLLGAPRATRPLLDLLEADGEGMVRVYAAEALGRIGDVSVAPGLAYYLIFDEEPFRKRSEKGRTDAYFTIDSEVSKALVEMGISGGLDFMIRQLGEPHRVRVLHEAVLTLRRVTGREFDFSPDGSAEQRREAAGRWRRWFDEHREEIRLPEADLEDSGLRARLERLVDRLGHFHFLNMSRARETLVLLGEAGVPWLRAGLKRPEVHVRVHCAEVLGRIRSKSSRGF